MPPTRSIGFEIKSLSNLIKRKIDQNGQKLDVAKFTGVQSWIIGYIFDHKDADKFQRDIEAEFRIRRSTATGVIQRMEKNGLIRRESVPYDARLKKLTLTPKAIQLHAKISCEIDDLEKRLAAGLTEKEIDDFFSIMAKIKKTVE